MITDNESDHAASGHWGVPTFVFENEPFFGQDRIDLLIWRMQSKGLTRRGLTKRWQLRRCMRRCFGPLRVASLQIFQVQSHLLQCKAQCEKPLHHLGGQAARQAFMAQRGDFSGVVL